MNMVLLSWDHKVLFIILSFEGFEHIVQCLDNFGNALPTFAAVLACTLKFEPIVLR